MDEHFYSPVNHREQIACIFPGEGFTLPHSPGLQARPSVVYIVLPPGGIRRREERARAIFYWLSAKLNTR